MYGVVLASKIIGILIQVIQGRRWNDYRNLDTCL